MPPIRLAILSDDPFFRKGVRQMLLGGSTFVVSEHDRAERNEIVSRGLDVVLIDSRMSGVLQLCSRTRTDRPYLLFLSVPDDAVGMEALAAGARGIIRKDDRMTHLARAICVVHEGGVWAPRRLLVDAWLRSRRGAVADSRAANLEGRLSAREREVLRCVVIGMSNKELADHLCMSTSTAKAHLTHIFQKLGVQGRGELTAAYHGTLTAEPLQPVRRPPLAAQLDPTVVRPVLLQSRRTNS